MVSVTKILNLSRKFVPELSKISSENKIAISQIPEMRLGKMLKDGAKDIVHVDMNHCAVVNPNKVNILYTDGLAGCNSVGGIFYTKNNEPIVMLSHYVPTQCQRQATVISDTLKYPQLNIDTNVRPRLFFNIANANYENKIVETVKQRLSFFTKEPEITVTKYSTVDKSPFDSHANIFQFDTNNNKVKITNVGEKENFVDLMI